MSWGWILIGFAHAISTTELRIEDGGKSQDVGVSPVEQQKAP